MLGIIGAGSWGSALAIVLANNPSIEVVPLWARNVTHLKIQSDLRCNTKYLPNIILPGKIKVVANLPELLQQVQDLLIAVPSHAFSQIIATIKPYINENHRIIWATKGLDPETGKFLAEIIAQQLGKTRKCAVLSGPSFATEVAQGLPSAVTVAANDPDLLQDLVGYFHCNNFRIYTSTDLIGVQVGGIVKNVLAVAAGIADGLGFGANARAALITRGLAEMQKFGLAIGAKAETLTGLSGLGDLILTCTDNQSRNRRFGLAIAEGKSIAVAQQEIGQVIEAIYNAKQLCAIAEKLLLELPIATQVNLILQNQITPQQAAHNLITRKPGREFNL